MAEARLGSCSSKHPYISCGILPKNCRVAPSPLDTQTASCDTWHRSFHPDISHPEFFSVDIPPGYLTSGILSGRRSTFFGYFAAGACHRVREENDSTSPDRHVRILWWRLPGQLGSSDARDSPDPFPPTIKKAATILTTKSPELSLIFNARYIRQDIPQSSQVSWHIPDI